LGRGGGKVASSQRERETESEITGKMNRNRRARVTERKKGEKQIKPLYSAEFIKSLGFDPSLKAGIGVGGGSGSGVSKAFRKRYELFWFHFHCLLLNS
jgi:hypothetical protein